MIKPLNVFVSRGLSHHPDKRQVEQSVTDLLALDPRVKVTMIPNLYDLRPDGDAYSQLKKLDEDFIVISWMFQRAAHWILDRNGVLGQTGEVEFGAEEDDDADELEDDILEEEEKQRVIETLDIPDRSIYCLQLQHPSEPQHYVDEVVRIAESSLMQWISGTPDQDQLDRFLNAEQRHEPELTAIEEKAGRRWYPVIDFSRCTNCMECIDFCLFGVYGVDTQETILVEQPDNCRKGCPACSRVCPENAIVFPQHKSPAIAGAPAETGGLKIDLSLLFGAPDAQEVAARERDEQLMLAGRAPAEESGNANGSPAISMEPRQVQNVGADKDDLDHLIAGLDSLDL